MPSGHSFTPQASFTSFFRFAARRLRPFAAVIGLSLSLAAFGSRLAAQTSSEGATPAMNKPGAPAGSYPLSGFENVNLFNGNLNFSLPLVKVGGRGKAQAIVNLAIDSSRWHAVANPVLIERTLMTGGALISINSETTYTVCVEVSGEPGTHSCDSQTEITNDFEFDGRFVHESPAYLLAGGFEISETPIGPRPGYGPGILFGRKARFGGAVRPLAQNNRYTRTLTRLFFIGPDNTEYELRDALTGGAPMSHLSTSAYLRGTIFVGNDGSNLRFQADEPIADMVCSSTGVCPDTYEFMPSGYLYFPDGTIYRIVAGNVTWIRDVEGNRITYAYNDGQVIQITDSLGRQVNISYGQPTGNPHEYYDAISFQGEGGEWRQVKVYRTTLEYALRSGFHLMTMPEMFPEMLLSPGSSYDPIGVVSRVELPDERSYRLFYTPYNEIARVELPTGAAIEYDYPMPTENGAPPQGGTVFRPLRERRVYAQSNTQNAPFEVKQVYVRGSDGNNSVVSVETQVRQVAGGTVTTQAKEAHSFYGEPNHSIRGFYTPWSLGREYKTEVFTPDGNTLLRRSETEWENPRTVPWNGGGVVANGARVKSVTTTVAEADPDLVAKVEYQ